MISHSGNLVMVYNGGTYNTTELQNDLTAQHCTFRGTSDTEVILEAFEYWGIKKTTEKLNGMFAIEVWNPSECNLTLIRDRLGIKQLYIWI